MTRVRSYWRQRPRRIAEPALPARLVVGGAVAVDVPVQMDRPAPLAGPIGDEVVVSAIFVFRKAFRLACGRRAGGYGLLVRVRQTRKVANGMRLNLKVR